jgi:hypothetical protein
VRLYGQNKEERRVNGRTGGEKKREREIFI